MFWMLFPAGPSKTPRFWQFHPVNGYQIFKRLGQRASPAHGIDHAGTGIKPLDPLSFPGDNP